MASPLSPENWKWRWGGLETSPTIFYISPGMVDIFNLSIETADTKLPWTWRFFLSFNSFFFWIGGGGAKNQIVFQKVGIWTPLDILFHSTWGKICIFHFKYKMWVGHNKNCAKLVPHFFCETYGWQKFLHRLSLIP